MKGILLKNYSISKIVSGGQTGADRGGLDAAVEAGVPHGGWCPKGRKAEDGRIPVKYDLAEMRTADYLARTRQNVIDSHVTLVFTYGKPTGGSAKTIAFAGEYCRPYLHIDLSQFDDNKRIAECILRWMQSGGLSTPDVVQVPACPVVNIAGSRESKAQGIQQRVKNIVLAMLTWKEYMPGAE
jgi:hypothetical protein